VVPQPAGIFQVLLNSWKTANFLSVDRYGSHGIFDERSSLCCMCWTCCRWHDLELSLLANNKSRLQTQVYARAVWGTWTSMNISPSQMPCQRCKKQMRYISKTPQINPTNPNMRSGNACRNIKMRIHRILMLSCHSSATRADILNITQVFHVPSLKPIHPGNAHSVIRTSIHVTLQASNQSQEQKFCRRPQCRGERLLPAHTNRETSKLAGSRCLRALLRTGHWAYGVRCRREA